MWTTLAGAGAAVAAGGGALMWYACAAPGSQIFGPALVRGPRSGRQVALTFDDGPAAPFTEQILDILRARKITATFFVCGMNVERHPEIVQRIRSEGHTLGNHSYSHPLLCFRSRARIGEEIDRAQLAIEKATSTRPVFFRPPFGARWFGLFPALKERGLRVVQWSVDSLDWKRPADLIVSSTLQALRPGSVVLMHDGEETRTAQEIDRSNTVKALPMIVDGALEAGFRFVSVGEFCSASEHGVPQGARG